MDRFTPCTFRNYTFPLFPQPPLSKALTLGLSHNPAVRDYMLTRRKVHCRKTQGFYTDGRQNGALKPEAGGGSSHPHRTTVSTVQLQQERVGRQCRHDPRADGGYCSPGGHDWGSKPDTVADESAWKVIRLRQRGRAENRSGSQESTGGLSSRKGGGTFSQQVVEQMGELEISSRWAGQQVRHRRASVKQG